MTTENDTFQRLLETVKFHVHDEALRSRLSDFLAINKGFICAAPASGGHHHAVAGGFLQHTAEVVRYAMIDLQDAVDMVPLNWNTARLDQAREDLVVAAVLHDIHKIGDPFGRKFYEPNMILASRKKGETAVKQSEAKPFARNPLCYTFTNAPKSQAGFAVAMLLDRNKASFHEGEFSLFYVHATDPVLYGMLNDEVKFCIRHHDGAYSSGASYEMFGKETPVHQALHHADMRSSRQGRWLKVIESADPESESPAAT